LGGADKLVGDYCCEGAQALAAAAQGGCGVSILAKPITLLDTVLGNLLWLTLLE